jgi:hypothetical protein
MIVSLPIQERLLRFPNLFLQAYEFRFAPVTEFSKEHFFNALFRCRTFNNDFISFNPGGARPSNLLTSDQESTHGPFAIALMRPSHYKEVPFLSAVDEIRLRVDTRYESADEPAEGRFYYPDPPTSGRRLDEYLETIGEKKPRCFKLDLTILEAGDQTFSAHFSELHKLTGILWHFEEWVTFAESDGEVHLFFIAYD